MQDEIVNQKRGHFMKPLGANIPDHTESRSNAHLAINTQRNSSLSLATQQVFNHVPKDTWLSSHKERTGPSPSVSVLFSLPTDAPQVCSANCAHSTSHVLGHVLTLRKSADSLMVAPLYPSSISFTFQIATLAFSPCFPFNGHDRSEF